MTPSRRRPDLPPTRRGYSPHECVSALQKAVRRSQVPEAVYWGYELWNSGYDNWAWARLKTICCEDVGPADRNLPATIHALEDWSKLEKKKKGGGGMEFVHAVILLASAPKSRIACYMVIEADSDNQARLEIPDEALDRHTRQGRAQGRGWEHFLEEADKLVQPEERSLKDGKGTPFQMLRDLESEARDNFRRRMEKDKTLPKNPWRPGKNDEPMESYLPTEEPKGDVQDEMPV